MLVLSSAFPPPPRLRPRLAVRLGACAALLFAAACVDEQPVEPDVPADRAEQSLPSMESDPFIYYFDRTIPLTVDPGRVVVESEASDLDAVVADVVSAAGGELARASGRSDRPGWRVVELAGGEPSVTRAVVEALREDERIQFSSHVYLRSESGDQVVPLNRLVVRFDEMASRSRIDSLVADLGAEIERAPQPGDARPHWLTYPSDADPLEFAASLHNHALVHWADPDRYGVGVPLGPTDATYYGDQWHLNNLEDSVGGLPVNINVEVAWEHATGSGVRVAVFDDGVEMFHPDIDDNFSVSGDLWYDLWYPDGPGIPDCSQEDLGCVYEPVRDGWIDDHGTAVAGLIAGKGNDIAGVAPDVKIVPVRIAGGDSIMSNAQLTDAFYWAADSVTVSVINFSWGWSSATTLTDAINHAANRGGSDGIVIVAAAGNFDESSPLYPASLDSVLAVGAVQKDGAPAGYSHANPDLAAPGGSNAGECAGDIVSTDLLSAAGCSDGPGSDADYTSSFGATSASAAIVSGVAALVREVDGGLSSDSVRARILNNADAWGSYTSADVGAGMLNAFAALGVSANAMSVDDIVGPTVIESTDTYEWEVDHSGGDGRFTYDWDVYWVDSTQWNDLGSGKTQELTAGPSDGAFKLAVEVASAGDSDADTILVAPPLTVDDISGPTVLDTVGTYEWEAMHSGGDGQNYSYQWEVYWDQFGQWFNAGQNKTQQFMLDETDGSFTLKVTVTSSGDEDSDTHVVLNWINCANPPNCEQLSSSQPQP